MGEGERSAEGGTGRAGDRTAAVQNGGAKMTFHVAHIEFPGALEEKVLQPLRRRLALVAHRDGGIHPANSNGAGAAAEMSECPSAWVPARGA